MCECAPVFNSAASLLPYRSAFQAVLNENRGQLAMLAKVAQESPGASASKQASEYVAPNDWQPCHMSVPDFQLQSTIAEILFWALQAPAVKVMGEHQAGSATAAFVVGLRSASS